MTKKIKSQYLLVEYHLGSCELYETLEDLNKALASLCINEEYDSQGTLVMEVYEDRAKCLPTHQVVQVIN